MTLTIPLLPFGRRGKIKLQRQTELSECGLACVAMVAQYHSIETDLGSLRRLHRPSLRGATLKALIDIASKTGLSSRVVKVSIEDLENLKLPVILHWNFNRYVVLEAVRGDRFLIHDPAFTSKWVDEESVSQQFTGVAIELEKIVVFETKEKPTRLRLSQLWSQLSGLKRALAQTLILSIILQVFVMVMPYYMQLAIDRVVPSSDVQLLLVLAIGFALFTIFNVLAGLLRSTVILSAGTVLGLGLASNIARRLFRLPIDWFEKRRTGDVLSRFQSIIPIREFLSTGVISAVLDGVLSLATLALIAFYSMALAILAVVATVLCVLVRFISFSYEQDAIEGTITANALEQTTLMETLRNMTALRLSNGEMARHSFWLSRLTDKTNADIKLAQVGIWQQSANGLLFGIENILAIYLVISFVLDGSFTIGMVFAYMAYKVQFADRIVTLIDQYVAFKMIGLHLERISDVALSPEDVSFRDLSAENAELCGMLELKKISFRYSETDPIILEDLDLEISPGEHVAITGPSGAGKSTLIKVLLGLLQPTSGEVLVDGVPLGQFGYQNFHGQVAAVVQDDTLFIGSLAENIALFDDGPDEERIVDAAKKAAIHDEILGMPMQYQTIVGDLGMTISGGQKQRILLARALYREPKMLVIDEGTSHLDLENEGLVNDAIREIGITRIIVAHRPQSIASADRVLKIEGKKLVPHFV